MRFAVTGASGRLGQLVVGAMKNRAPDDILRLLSRRELEIDASDPHQRETAQADFDRPETLPVAFAGVDTLLLISTIGPPEQRLRQHLTAISAAVRAGVRHIVYTSYSGADFNSPFSFARVHAATEAALRASGTDFTILRIAQYAEVLDTYIAAVMGRNSLIMPSAKAYVSYVPRQTVASVAVGTMMGHGHGGKTYEITGSQAVSATELAAWLGELRGTPPTIVDVDIWEFAQATMIPFGAPKFMVEAMAQLWLLAKDGVYAAIDDSARQLAVTPPQDLRDYVHTVARRGMSL